MPFWKHAARALSHAQPLVAIHASLSPTNNTHLSYLHGGVCSGVHAPGQAARLNTMHPTFSALLAHTHTRTHTHARANIYTHTHTHAYAHDWARTYCPGHYGLFMDGNQRAERKAAPRLEGMKGGAWCSGTRKDTYSMQVADLTAPIWRTVHSHACAPSSCFSLLHTGCLSRHAQGHPCMRTCLHRTKL